MQRNERDGRTHFVTYATHDERYLPLLRATSGGELVELGRGRPWRGLKDKADAVVAYCEKVVERPDDVVAFVDGFDSVVVSPGGGPGDLFERYRRSFPANAVVFSAAGDPPTVWNKYVQDKLFGACRGDRLNSGMYVGPAWAVAAVWRGIAEGDDDQAHATRVCRSAGTCASSFCVVVDVANALFYNVSSEPGEMRRADDGRLVVTKSGGTPCVVSAPNQQDLSPALAIAGLEAYAVPPSDDSMATARRIGTYWRTFSTEIVAAIVAAAIVVLDPFGSRTAAIVVCALIASAVVLHETYAAHIDGATPARRALYVAIELLHTLTVIVTFVLLYNPRCDVIRLLLLDVIYLAIVLLFFLFRRCVLTMLSERAIGDGALRPYFSPADHVRYWWDRSFRFTDHAASFGARGEHAATDAWIKGNVLTATLVLLVNGYCLVRILVMRRRGGGSCGLA